MRLFIVFISSLLLLSSCLLGPQPGPPETKLPAAIRGDSAPHGKSFGDKAWQKVFTDSTLRRLIEYALANNPDLVAATYRIEQARAQAAAAHSDWFPHFDGSAGAERSGVSRNAGNPSGDRNISSYNIGASFAWELDLWGKICRSNQAARARLLEAAYLRDAVQTSLVSSVATAYMELKNLDERLAISQRTAKSREESLQLVTARRDGGVSSDLEVGQAEALLGQARTAIPITEQAIAAKENEIRALLGSFPGPISRGGDLSHLDNSLKINGGLPASLLERRSDIAAASQAYQAAVAEIGVAEALRLPAISLTGNGGFISNDFSKLLQGKSLAYNLAANLAGPIFDAGLSKSRVDAAKARAGEARAEFEKVAKQAFREAADSINAHLKTGQIIEEESRLVNSLRNVSGVASERFKGGESSYLEVLDAERNLFTSELELADARRDRLLSVVQAYRALGGGWQ